MTVRRRKTANDVKAKREDEEKKTEEEKNKPRRK
jgi:hypothetical protein